MTEHTYAAALAETFSEAARTDGDAVIGPIGRSVALPALRVLLDLVTGLIDDLDRGMPGLGSTEADILATALRVKTTTDAADAFVALLATA